MIEAFANSYIGQIFLFLGEGPRGDFWNIFSNILIYIFLVSLSFWFYKKTEDEFFNFMGYGFLAFIFQKAILFIAIASKDIWHILTPAQLEPWFPPMEHFFETVAVLLLSFSFCYISLMFRGVDVKVDSSILTPWKKENVEVKMLNYIFILGLAFAFIGYLFVAVAWNDFFINWFKYRGETTTFGQFWGDLTIELIHASIYICVIAYVSYKTYPQKKGDSKHLITTFFVIAASLNAIGHLLHVNDMVHGEAYIAISDSTKRVFEYVGNFFYFGILFVRLSDRMEKKRFKIAQTLDEVREFTKGFFRISEQAADSKFLDLDIKLPEIKSDEELRRLSISIKNMIDTIKKREDAVHASSQELQVLNEELSAAYEELRNIYDEQERHIEELKVSQGDLRAEKNKVDAILASIGDGMSIQDTDYNIIFVNDFYKRLFGKNLIGKKCYAEYEKKGAVCDDCPLKESFETGDVVRSTRVGIDKNNNELIVDITASPIKDENGTIIGGIELAKDVTKRFMLENQLKKNVDELNVANEKLVKMDMIKTNFVGMASHELRTPLTMIKGYSELLMNERSEKLDDVTTDMISNIYSSAERLGGIIADILDVSRMDEKQLHLSMEKNEINKSIEQASSDLKHYTNERQQEITFTLDEKIKPFYFDSSRIYQVISNLVGNAIKYTPDGGKIAVSTNLVPKDNLKSLVENYAQLNTILESGNDYIEIAIKDNGIGIDADEQRHIFDRFYEVGSINEHATSKSDFLGGGAGLGLSICKGIVEAHGGILWVYSKGYDDQERNGSEFHILLPYLEEEPKKEDEEVFKD